MKLIMKVIHNQFDKTVEIEDPKCIPRKGEYITVFQPPEKEIAGNVTWLETTYNFDNTVVEVFIE